MTTLKQALQRLLREHAAAPAEDDTVGECKQVILIRRDLKMRRGKEIAQGSHASMAFLRERMQLQSAVIGEVSLQLSPPELHWMTRGMAKVCVKVNSEEELLERHERAVAAGLQSHLIRDSGKTEFDGVATLTACAIGPDLVDKIDAVTGDLSLY